MNWPSSPTFHHVELLEAPYVRFESSTTHIHLTLFIGPSTASSATAPWWEASGSSPPPIRRLRNPWDLEKDVEPVERELGDQPHDKSPRDNLRSAPSIG